VTGRAELGILQIRPDSSEAAAAAIQILEPVFNGWDVPTPGAQIVEFLRCG
jgi:hypothetical protein